MSDTLSAIASLPLQRKAHIETTSGWSESGRNLCRQGVCWRYAFIGLSKARWHAGLVQITNQHWAFRRPVVKYRECWGMEAFFQQLDMWTKRKQSQRPPSSSQTLFCLHARQASSKRLPCDKSRALFCPSCHLSHWALRFLFYLSQTKCTWYSAGNAHGDIVIDLWHAENHADSQLLKNACQPSIGADDGSER